MLAPEAFRNFVSEMESLQGKIFLCVDTRCRMFETHMPLGERSQSPASSDKTKRLADLFRPPFDIMYQGDFESVREQASQYV
jgi:hypothetical protein